MAELADNRPFPPGRYPIVVVGSGPGGLQLAYSLSHLGVPHAAISADDAPGGMFRKWPVFQRMLSWTKPYPGFPPGSREFERCDWNSLAGEDADHRGLMAHVMDRTSHFPSRPEMQKGLELFASRSGLRIRYGCRWEATRNQDGEFVLETSDGEYRARTVVFAVGVAQPLRPPIPGAEHAALYGELRPIESYKDRRVFIIGKQNSGFEIASGLLPWARQIILASPSSTKLSVNTHSLVGVRARYVQPVEDWALAGGVVILDAAIEEIKPAGGELQVRTRTTANVAIEFAVDDVIAATGFLAPLQDLPQLGVTTFGQSGLPAQTAFWESLSVPGIYFAGTINQGAKGLVKHGIPSNSGAVQGYRYNARVLARRLAELHGVEIERRTIPAADVVSTLLGEATRGPELWHQRSYLARVIAFDRERGIVDEGILPLVHFLDSGEFEGAAALTLESNGKEDLYPIVYVRQGGRVKETPLPDDPFLNFETAVHRSMLADALKPLLSPSLSRAGE
ncbi:MAG TPA: NAD(P)-binding domain-containing protein [Candidatus Dormibacteraeota bacterium]|nr:NAD(P)-binding domain-containing protein [Candidatus Dormibacteraeota bacterium]